MPCPAASTRSGTVLLATLVVGAAIGVIPATATSSSPAAPQPAAPQPAASAAATSATDTATTDDPAARPNVLFIFSDDHAPHAIGAYGGPLAALDPTPNIDALAADGVLFRNSFCTNSICGPSRAVILTGKHSFVNGFRQNGDRFDGGQPTFPKMLQAAGYQTAVIGKWHLGSEPQGFDHWQILPGQGLYYNPDFITPDGRVRIDGHCTDIVTDLAIEWLETARADGRPFFLMAQHKAPHRNWMPAARHFDLWADVDVPEPDTLFDDYADNVDAAHIQEMSIEDELYMDYDLFVLRSQDGEGDDAAVAVDRSGWMNLDRMTPEQRAAWDTAYEPRNEAFRAANLTGDDLIRWKYQRYIKNYLRSCRGVDESVGQLLAYLDETGLAANTIVIYASDQGFFLGDHGWYDKRWMYEESMKMPLIVRWPGVADDGREQAELVQNIDYAPTFLELAGLSVPEDMQGRSLVPLLREADAAPGRDAAPTDDWRDAVYYHYHAFPATHMVAAHYGVRTDRYKLIHFYQFDQWEFYDLERDPDERTNRYDDPAAAAVIAGLRTRLAELQAQYGENSDLRPRSAEWQAPFRAKVP